MKEFNDSIKKIIEKFSYNFLIVQQNFEVHCSCKDFTTKHPDPACPKCLGTGHKIKIKKMRGASQDSEGSFRISGSSETSSMATFYIDAKYKIYEDNIIVDEDGIFMIHRLERKKTANKELVYYKAFCNPKKNRPTQFRKNFDRIMKGGR